MEHAPSVGIFLAQVVVLLLVGRAAGELMHRIGQPPVIGQILAGVLLGPSVAGALSPVGYQQLFPPGAAQQAMLNALAQLGILLLLLLTGMETDLSVFRRARRAALSISASGIVLPLACGIALGLMLPEAVLPQPGRRMITALFLGTALAISSVKIVALVVRELGFLRRTIGQVIIAAAVLDDTIGWIIMSVIFGLALHGQIDTATVSRSVLGTLLFLVLAFTVGRRLVFLLIRWSNDALASEMATVTTILVITGLAALLTEAIGVHFVLGAFIAGVLIGQSPILTRQLTSQVRGLIIALFMPVFFATAGLATDVRSLATPGLLSLTAVLIVIASVGKFLGAFVGGRLGGLKYSECFAVGCGMNARGSTEVIVASIGLSMGALSQSLFTAIVAMAIVTTMAMPPTLRWALRRLPMEKEEQERLDREEFEAGAFLKQVERLLVAVDETPTGQFALRLAGLLAGVRRITTTVLHLAEEPAAHAVDDAAQPAARTVQRAVRVGDRAAVSESVTVDVVTRAETLAASDQAIASEAKKGYGLIVIGREPAARAGAFAPQVRRSALGFSGAFTIALARGRHRERPDSGVLRVLVPVTGTRYSREGAEVAIALAQASRGAVTALYVDSSGARADWRQRFGRAIAPSHSAQAAVREIVEIGEHYRTAVQGRIRNARTAADAIARELAHGDYNLLVMGVSPRPGRELFFGEVAAQILERSQCSLLFISGEAITEPEAAAAAPEVAAPG